MLVRQFRKFYVKIGMATCLTYNFLKCPRGALGPLLLVENGSKNRIFNKANNNLKITQILL